MTEHTAEKTILIVDDEATSRRYIATMLQHAGYRSMSAVNGPEALRKAREAAPDLVLLDIIMPEMDGFAVCKAMRSDPALQHIPIIIVTGLEEKESRIRGLQCGANDYITKPFDTMEVMLKIGNLLKLKEYEQELRLQNERLEDAVRTRTADLARAVEELRSAEMFSRELFNKIKTAKMEWEKSIDAIKDLIVLVNSKGEIKRCNRSFQQFIGRSYADLLGAAWSSICREIAGSDAPEVKNESVCSYEAQGRSFEVVAFSFQDLDGTEGRIFTIRDVTELRAMTRALETEHRKLEQAYNDLKLAQAKVVQQEKMATIGQLAAGVAHEINNPTGFIMSNLGSLQKYAERLKTFIRLQSDALAGLPEEVLQPIADQRRMLKIDAITEDLGSLLRESLDGAERITKIVQDLKSFSRVDEPEMKRVDINAGIESTINIVWNELKYKASITKEYGPIPPIMCNAGQLNQVFMNLLVNAAHAIEKQGLITIRTWNEGGNVNVAISDTGCGIPPEQVGRIFEPFYTTKPVGQGTGLGLAIACDIVKKHNGTIEVVSEVGKGTTFTIRLPITPDKDKQETDLIATSERAET